MIYLNKIYKTFTWIQVLCEDLERHLIKDSIARNLLVIRLKEIKEVIEEQKKNIDIYCTEHNIKFSSYAENAYKDCKIYLNRAIVVAENNTISDAEIPTKCETYFSTFFSLVQEKYEEYVEDWIIEHIDSGQIVSKNYFVVKLDDDYTDKSYFYRFCYFFWVALRTEKLFFSANRNHSSETQKILTQFYNAHFSNGATIDLQEKSGRTIITAASGAVIRSLARVNMQTAAASSIHAVTGWTNSGKGFGSRFTVERGEDKYVRKDNEPLKIHGQHFPTQFQVANEKIIGVGAYSHGGSNIMEEFDSFTNKDKTKEQALARLLLRYKLGDSNALCEEELQTHQLNLPTDTTKRRAKIGRLNKTAYLICFVEAYRRIPQDHLFKDFLTNENNLPEFLKEAIRKPQLPFGFGIALLLIMLSDGILRFDQVFNHESEYGIFAHDSVMHKNVEETIRRFISVIDLYEFYYLSEKKPIIGCITDSLIVLPTPEYCHSVLQRTDGNEEDSDNEDYNRARLDETEETLLLRSFQLWVGFADSITLRISP